MKDSGIEWIGEIPRSWEVAKIKNCIKAIGSGTTPTSNKTEYYDGDIFWIQSGDLYGSAKIIDTKSKITTLALKSCSALKLYKKNFLVIAMYGASVGNISISCINACTNQACCVIYPNMRNDLRFMYYWLIHAKQDLLQKSIGGGQPNISQQIIRNLVYVEPNLSEQQAIADFLDAKCSELDGLAADIRSQIDTFKEYKKSLITQAVTKGLNPQAEMKDSGIEWIGEIPKGWQCIKAKYCIIIQNGSDPKRSGEIPVYGSGADSFKTCGESKRYPTVLIGRKGATLHIPHYIDHAFWNVDTAFNVYVQDNYVLRYYYYCAYSFDYKSYISQTTLPSMTQSNYENMKLPYPSKVEQQAIADFLDAKCSELDALISAKEQQLSALSDYKKSLICQYVTGKKQVLSK